MIAKRKSGESPDYVLWQVNGKGRGTISVILHLGAADINGVNRISPQPWIEAAPSNGKDAPEASWQEIIAELGKRDIASASFGSDLMDQFIDEFAAAAQAQGYKIAHQWPAGISPGSKRQFRMYRTSDPAAGSDAFAEAYRAALAQATFTPEQDKTVYEAAKEIERVTAETVYASPFHKTAGVCSITAVGSAHRGTYISFPVDFDLIVLTSVPQEKISRDDAAELMLDIILKAAQRPAVIRYWRMLGKKGTPELKMLSLDTDGPYTLLARAGSGDEKEMVDISFGVLHRAVGFENATMRYYSALPDGFRTRLKMEIRLAKQLFRQLGLYALKEGGLGSHTIEQWVIQANYYRDSLVGTGTLDNLLMLVAEESEGRRWNEFKSGFPVRHPGVWERSLVPESCPEFNMLDYLGRGQKAGAEAAFGRIVELARNYRAARIEHRDPGLAGFKSRLDNEF